MRPLDYISPREIIKELKRNPKNQIRLPKTQLELDQEKDIKPRPKIKKFVLTKPAVWHDQRDARGSTSEVNMSYQRDENGEMTATEIKLPMIMPSMPSNPIPSRE